MKTEINGFTIREYNQHNLKDGARYSTCPICSHTRKSNKKQKCALLDWDTALGTCCHCGEVFQLHTYGKKKPLKPYYAYKDNKNGTSTFWHADGTETII